MLRRRGIPELVGGDHLDSRRSRIVVVAGVHVGEHLSRLDPRTALGVHDDAHGVVDLVLLRAPAGAEMHRGVSDPDRAQGGDVSVAGRLDPSTTGATGSASSSAVPPCASIQRRHVSSAEPSATAASARRRPSASSIPRSE